MNPYEVAGEYGQRGLMDVLGIYQQHQNQKRLEMQQQAERQMRAQDMADKAEQREAQRKLWQDQENQRLAAADTARAQVMDPNTPVEQLPASWVETKTVKAPSFSDLPDQGAEFAGPQASDIQIGTQDKFVKTPKKFVEHGGYVAPLDIGGVAEQRRKQQERIASGQAVPVTPELSAALEKLGLGTYKDVVPAPIMGVYQQQLRDEASAEREGRRIQSSEKIAANRDAAMLHKLTAASSGAESIHPELSGPELLAAITKENPGEGALLKGIVGGSIDIAKSTSIRANRREIMAGLASRIDPDYDMSNQPTRAKMRADYATGNVAANVRSINTAINHLATLNKAVSTLDPSSYPWLNKGINWYKDKTGSGDIVGVKSAMLATATEMAAALKGGRAAPSESEIQEQLAVLNQNASPEQWKTIIRQRGELLAARLNSARQGWVDQFGREPDKPLVRTDTRKRMRELGLEDLLEETGSVVPGESGAQSDKYGIRGMASPIAGAR